jgi:hypothetical protein
MARRRRTAVAGAAIALAAAVAAGGCSVEVGTGGDELDTQELEQNIADSEEETRGFRPTVECPEDVEISEGDEFTCTATDPQGNTATVFVTQTSDDGDVRWRLVADQDGDGGGTTTS